MKLLIVLSLFLFSGSLLGQQCESQQFSIRSQGVDYLTIRSASEVITCSGINICSEIQNGKQSLAITSDGQVSISSGNSISLPDTSNTNELQTLTINGAELSLSGNGGTVTLPDSSSINEIQRLSINAGILTISDGNSIDLPDSSTTNELQILLVNNVGALSISNGNTIQLPDANSTNEIQSLSLSSGGVLSISQGNDVQLPDASATNEIQTLVVSGYQLTLSSVGGTTNTIELSAQHKKFLGFSFALPAGTAFVNGNQVYSIVQFNTFGDSTYNSATGIFTAPLTGFYRFTLRGYLGGISSTSAGDMSFVYNIQNVYRGHCGFQIPVGITSSPIPDCTYIAKLSAGDNVYLVVYCDAQLTLGSTNPGGLMEWQGEFLGI